jgi:CHAD domain-containing protein
MELRNSRKRRHEGAIQKTYELNIQRTDCHKIRKEAQAPRYFPEFLSSKLMFLHSYAFGEAVMCSVMMVLASSPFSFSIGLAAGT